MTQDVRVQWTENGAVQSAQWRSESGAGVPRRVQVVDDTLNADAAYRLACEGTALLWRGDFHNARQLLAALARRAGRKPQGKRAARVQTPQPQAAQTAAPAAPAAQAFHQHRQAQAQRARVLGALLIPMQAGYAIALRRAPDVAAACTEAWGPASEACVVSLRELQGAVGAHEWRKKGVPIAALGASIHPHYGVFSPVRGEYLDLVAAAPLPSTSLAFDIGTGTGVLAALLAHRGVQRVLATDQDARALACARENLARLGFADKVEVLQADLFPPGQAPVVVCNPPWLPARPSSALEHAVYDEGSRMLRGFLGGLAAHLSPGGEGWLILSDLAEHLGLRTRDELLGWISASGLKVQGRTDVRPRHAKAADPSDPLHAARAAERTSLWRLTVA